MDIPDLTPMNEVAARALFAEDAVQRTEGRATEKGRPAEEVADLMQQARGLANRRWERGDVDPMTATYYRERALAVSLASWQALAEQVWDVAHEQGRKDEHWGDSTKNPYRNEV